MRKEDVEAITDVVMRNRASLMPLVQRLRDGKPFSERDAARIMDVLGDELIQHGLEGDEPNQYGHYLEKLQDEVLTASEQDRQ
jgi:hypothetical protein